MRKTPGSIFWHEKKTETCLLYTYCWQWENSVIHEDFAFVKKRNDGRWEYRVHIHKGNTFGLQKTYIQHTVTDLDEAKRICEELVNQAKPEEIHEQVEKC